jgi:hypothetical protein
MQRDAENVACRGQCRSSAKPAIDMSPSENGTVMPKRLRTRRSIGYAQNASICGGRYPIPPDGLDARIATRHFLDDSVLPHRVFTRHRAGKPPW